jgi:predicted dehydrogenase
VLRGAFIGFGNVAEKGHLPGWQSREDVRIVAATDAVAARRETFRAACPGGQWYEGVEALLSDRQLDFVDICTPPSSHAALIEQALASGLHVLCEKPLVTKASDTVRIVAAAKRAARTVHTVHNWLHAPLSRKISELIAEGVVGRVQSIRWETLRTQPAVAVQKDDGTNWRADPAIAGGGILFDHGWHALYCVMHWGGIPGGISARLEKRRFTDWALEDTATVTLDHMPGTAEIYLTWASDRRANTIEIEGERGQLTVSGDVVKLATSSAQREWSCPPALSEGSHHRDWFAGVADDFCAAVTGGGTGNLDEAVRCAQLIDLAQQSSASGGLRLSTDR